MENEEYEQDEVYKQEKNLKKKYTLIWCINNIFN